LEAEEKAKAETPKRLEDRAVDEKDNGAEDKP